MKLAIMQPYLFPYIGYFQLIAAVDKFVIYDDVNYIKQGWINRNRILSNGTPLYFTIPLSGASSFTPIYDIKINKGEYTKWRDKFYKTVYHNYGNAPYFNTIMQLIENTFSSADEYVTDLIVKSLKSICRYLQINTKIVDSSRQYINSHLKSQDRIIDICKQEEATTYINMIGGLELSSRSDFANWGIDLKFLESKEIIYTQFNKPFVPWLSIIDILMFNTPEQVMKILEFCEIA